MKIRPLIGRRIRIGGRLHVNQPNIVKENVVRGEGRGNLKFWGSDTWAMAKLLQKRKWWAFSLELLLVIIVIIIELARLNNTYVSETEPTVTLPRCVHIY